MRTAEQWQTRYLPKTLSKLPVRIQHDLNKLPMPKVMPKHGSYYLHGDVRAGKTILAARMFVQAAQHFYMDAVPGQCLFVSVPEFFLEIKSTYGKPDGDELAVLAKYSEVEFLVLDDLGPEQSTEWMLSMLYLLINRRYENMRTTVITSNFGLDELTDKLGDARIPSRIGRMCKVLEVER